MNQREATLSKMVDQLEEEVSRLRTESIQLRRDCAGYKDEAKRLRETIATIQRQGANFYAQLGKQLNGSTAVLSQAIADGAKEIAKLKADEANEIATRAKYLTRISKLKGVELLEALAEFAEADNDEDEDSV